MAYDPSQSHVSISSSPAWQAGLAVVHSEVQVVLTEICWGETVLLHVHEACSPSFALG